MMRAAHVADEIADAARTLARHRLAAVILWNPPIGVLGGGVVLDALVSRQLLVAIFSPEPTNFLRTGAVVIRGHRVERAGVPFAWSEIVEGVLPPAHTPVPWIAVGVDERTGRLRLRDRRGRVAPVDLAELAEILRQAT